MTAAEFPLYHYRGQLVRIKDGDTAIVRFALGFNSSVDLPVRIDGLNAPELRGPDPDLARAAAAALADLLTGRQLYLRTRRDARSFERYVATVFVEEQAGSGTLRDVADAMRAAGFDVPQGG